MLVTGTVTEGKILFCANCLLLGLTNKILEARNETSFMTRNAVPRSYEEVDGGTDTSPNQKVFGSTGLI